MASWTDHRTGQAVPTRLSSLWDTPGYSHMGHWPRRVIVPVLPDYLRFAVHVLILALESAQEADPGLGAVFGGVLQQRVTARSVHYGVRFGAEAGALHVGKLILTGRLAAAWVRRCVPEEDEQVRALLDDAIRAVWGAGGVLGDDSRAKIMRSTMALHRHGQKLGYDRDPMLGPVLTAMRLYAIAPSALGAHGHVARALAHHGRYHHHDPRHVLGHALIDVLGSELRAGAEAGADPSPED